MLEPSDAERLALRRRPAGVPAGYQEWRRLLFVHWPVSTNVLRPLVPRVLSLDQFEGVAYVSLTPFVVQSARPLGVPRNLGLAFLETNVRTYVHLEGGQPGVYFFSLDVLAGCSWCAGESWPALCVRTWERTRFPGSRGVQPPAPQQKSAGLPCALRVRRAACSRRAGDPRLLFDRALPAPRATRLECVVAPGAPPVVPAAQCPGPRV
jgi:hypothetical protein